MKKRLRFKCLERYGLVPAIPVKSVFCCNVNRRSGGEPSTASVDTDFDPAPNVKVFIATLVMYRAFTL